MLPHIAKENFAHMINDLEMGRLSWIICIDPNCNQGEGVRRRQRREKAVRFDDATLRAMEMEEGDLKPRNARNTVIGAGKKRKGL